MTVQAFSALDAGLAGGALSGVYFAGLLAGVIAAIAASMVALPELPRSPAFPQIFWAAHRSVAVIPFYNLSGGIGGNQPNQPHHKEDRNGFG